MVSSLIWSMRVFICSTCSALMFTVFHAFGCTSGDPFPFLLANKPFHPQLLQDGFSEGYLYFCLFAHGCYLTPWGS